MTAAAAVLGGILGAALFAPVWCVTGHGDPGGRSVTRCQALINWLPSLPDDFWPGGLAGVAFFVAGILGMAFMFGLAAHRLGARSRP